MRSPVPAELGLPDLPPLPAAGPAAAVEARGLWKSYDGVPVLRGVDLRVEPGAVLALLGPNGAGKTTMLEILEGFRRADAGHVRVLGLDPAQHSLQLRQRVGVVLQTCGFPSHARVRELLEGWSRYYERPRPVDELLDLVELRNVGHTLIKNLSGGQRRRLDLALALLGDPDLIFLDEPTTGFDPDARRRCWTAISNLKSLHKTVVLTTHYLDEAQHLAEHVAILIRGVVHAMGSVPELRRAVDLPTSISFHLPSRGHVLPPGLSRGATSGANGDTRLCSADPPGTLRALLGWTRRHDVELRDLTVTPPTLDDIYRHYVGSDGDGSA